LLQDIAVQEHQGVERLVLRGGSDLLIDSEPGQKAGNVFGAKVLGMQQVMKANEAARPVKVGLLGTD
jgi:hypothetical protein